MVASLYSITEKYNPPQPKLPGQSFINVYIRGEGASVLSGLSDNCNPEIIMLVDEVIEKLLDPSDGIITNFYKPKRRKFEERIILKYAAKKLMELNHIDVVILARVADGNIDLQKFQMQLAQKLGIHKNEDNDDDVPDFLDDVLARRIHASLDKRNFMFISERYLDRRTIRRVGIPSDVRIGYFSKLVFVTESPVDYEMNVLWKDTNATWELARAQVQEYTLSQWSTSGEGVIRDTLFQIFDTKNIMECLANFPWMYQRSLVAKLFCLADIFFILPLDVNTRFKLVDALLNDLYELGLAFDEKLIPGFFQRCLIKLPFSSSEPEELTHFELLEKIFISFSAYTKESWQDLITTPKFPKLYALEITEDLPKDFPEDFFKKTENLRVLTIFRSNLSSLPSSITCLGETLKFLSLQGCKSLAPDSLSCIQALKNLEFLNLSFTQFEHLPDDTFQGLERLQFLDLSWSRHIQSLPLSVCCLQNLERFLLGGCEQLSVLPSSVLLMPKLDMLDLSSSMLTEIPDNFFNHMTKLRVLNLNSCKRLRIVTPSFRQVPKSLIELNISNCTSLENFKEVSSSVGDTLPSLEDLHCSQVKLDKLFSPKGCPNLNTLTLGGNMNVEVLDVSGTQLNKFSIEEPLPHLRRMDIVGTKCLCAIDWGLIKWLPEEVNWNEFGEENSSVWSRQEFGAPKDKNRGGVDIVVGSDLVFKTLQSTSLLWEKHFSQFHICLFPSIELGNEKIRFVPCGRICYDDIYMRAKSPFPYYKRFLEYAGGKRFPKYISNVLTHTEFLSLYDDRSIKRLSDLKVETMAELKECWIERCYSMETVFYLQPSDLAKPQPVLGCLEKLRISQVMNATNMCIIAGSLNKGSFGRLKHMHLEYCPKILNVFTSGLCLENLEVVEIKFCARLKEVFSGKGYNVEGSFNKLHTVRLIELPALTSIIEDVVDMPALTTIKVKGCRKLGTLPLRYTTSNSGSSSRHPIPRSVTLIVVSGEPDWWDRLQWPDKNVKEHISFESCPPLLKFPR